MELKPVSFVWGYLAHTRVSQQSPEGGVVLGVTPQVSTHMVQLHPPVACTHTNTGTMSCDYKGAVIVPGLCLTFPWADGGQWGLAVSGCLATEPWCPLSLLLHLSG